MKILIAVDGSEFDVGTLGAAVRLAKGVADEVKVITVIEPAAGTELETIIESTDDLIDPGNPTYQRALGVVKAATETLRNDGVVSVTYATLSGPPARRIVEAAEEWKADVIVIGSHGRGFWSRALMGSVSDRVVHHAHCSVLIARSGS